MNYIIKSNYTKMYFLSRSRSLNLVTPIHKTRASFRPHPHHTIVYRYIYARAPRTHTRPRDRKYVYIYIQGIGSIAYAYVAVRSACRHRPHAGNAQERLSPSTPTHEAGNRIKTDPCARRYPPPPPPARSRPPPCCGSINTAPRLWASSTTMAT